MPELDARQMLADYRRATAHDSAALDHSLEEASARLTSGETVPLPESGLGASAPGSGVTLKVLAAVGIVGAVAIGAWMLGSQPEGADVGAAASADADVVDPPREASPTAVPAPSPPVAPTPTPVVVPPEELEPGPETPVDPVTEPGKRRRTKKKAVAEAPNLDEEIRLMGEARRALSRGDAKKALAVLDEHKRRFPKGQLRSDREGSAITALCQLGREDAAQTRAKRTGREWRGCP